MKSHLTTFLKTVTGKAVVATGVVLLGFGGAAAAGLADVPAFTPAAERAAPQAQRDEATDETSEEATEDDSSEESTDGSSEESTEESTEELTEESTEASSDEATHGEIVSEFARTTELEGCEKGQAISELASSNAADHRQNPETDHDPCADESSEDESSEEESAVEAAVESSGDESTGDEPTHGEIVSEFARTTELEGCEKGQAISELASSNAAEHRQNPESDHDPCANGGDDSGDDSADDSAGAAETPAEITADESVATTAGPPAEAPGRSGEHGNSGNHGNQGNSGSRGNGNGRGK